MPKSDKSDFGCAGILSIRPPAAFLKSPPGAPKASGPRPGREPQARLRASSMRYGERGGGDLRSARAWTHKFAAHVRFRTTAGNGGFSSCDDLSANDPTATLRKQSAEAPISQWQLVAWLCGCLRIDLGVHWPYTFTSPVPGEDSTHGAYE